MTLIDTSPDTDPTDVEAPIRSHSWFYFASIAAVMAAGWFFGLLFTHLSFDLMWVEWNVGYIVWVIGLAALVHFFRSTSPQDFTGVLIFGVPTIVASGYPILVIPWLHELVVMSRGTYQMELPDEPEKIFRDEDVQIVPEGMVPPIRITFAEGGDAASGDPLKRRTTNEVSMFTRWRIRNFWDFYVRIQSEEEARRQLSDTGVGVLQEELTQLTVSQTFADLKRLNALLDNRVRERTKSWGIEIVDYNIKLVGVSHTLNIAIQKIAESEAARSATIIDADAEQQKRTKEGDGAANAIKAEITARGDGMLSIAKALGVEGKDVLAAETARGIGQGPSNTFILGASGMSELAGLGVALATKMTQKSTTEGATTT